MPQVDWNAIRNGYRSGQPDPYRNCNVRFFYAYNENKEKSAQEGRPIYDQIPSVSIQWAGMDETVRRIEPQDIATWPDKYAAFMAGEKEPETGTPLAEWAMCPGNIVRELAPLGFKTVEQLAAANDEVKRRLGTTAQYVKKAQEWLNSANSTQNQVTNLREQLEREKARTTKLVEQVELLLQRIEASEGTDLREPRKEVIRTSEVNWDDTRDSDPVEDFDSRPVRRGRPRKV